MELTDLLLFLLNLNISKGPSRLKITVYVSSEKPKIDYIIYSNVEVNDLKMHEIYVFRHNLAVYFGDIPVQKFKHDAKNLN